jgi:serine/threonine protein kinase
MAPEFFSKLNYVGHPIDVFALGVTLFNMVTGTYPFKEAKMTDPNYSFLARHRDDLFWDANRFFHLSIAL